MNIAIARFTWITCGVALLGTAAAAGAVSAQSLESRIANGRNGTLAFSFATRTGVCGNGNRIVSRSANGNDHYSVWEFTSNGSTNSYNMSTDDGRPDVMRDCEPGPAHVQITQADGSITRFRVTVGGSGPSADTDLGTVTPEEASRGLIAIAQAQHSRFGDEAIMAATLSSAQSETTTGLIDLSRNKRANTDVRKSAVYWLSQTDEPRATVRLKEILADQNEDTEVRKSSVFALSRHDSPEIIQLLLNTARTSDQPEIKKDAVFWLGQMAGEKSTAGLKSVLDDNSEEIDVRNAAIFALSRQKTEQALDILIDVATNSKEPAMRKQALFWLGQRGSDPRVLKLFQDILLKGN